jgi:hypothetical protein
MTKTNALSRWTPGPKSTGAMLEHGGWDHKAMRTTRWGIDGETALRAWAKGKSSMEVACAAAAACVDGEALRKILKDRRVGVRSSVLGNSNCPFEVLAEKASWRGKSDRSYTARREAQSTMRVAISKMSFEEGFAHLRDGLASEAYDLVFDIKRVTDEELAKVVETTFTADGGVAIKAADLIAHRGDISKRGDELLYTLAVHSGGGPALIAGHIARSTENRDALAARLLTLGEKNARVGLNLCRATSLSSEFHETLNAHLLSLGKSGGSAHMENPQAPWRMWEDTNLAVDGASDVLGRALCEMWGDAPEPWSLAASFIDDFSGTVRQMLDMLETFCPRQVA